MSADEFLDWMAYFRQSFVGPERMNWAQATLAREVNRTIPRKKGDKLPPFDAFLWRPPEPLMVQRLERQAATRKRKQSKPRKRDE